MDAVTYPDANVTKFIMDKVIPLRVPFDAEPIATDFNLKWTPMLVVMDENGKEHQRTIGFFPPEDLISSILVGIAKIYFDIGQPAEAIPYLEQVVSKYSKSSAAPEAIFLLAVCRYKSTHSAQPLKDAYEKLNAEYPQSEWKARALPYRLL